MHVVILSRGRFPGNDGPYRRTKLLGAGLVKNGCDITVIVAYPPAEKECDTEFIDKYGYQYIHTINSGYSENPTLITDVFHKIIGTLIVCKLFRMLHKQKPVDIIFIRGIGLIELVVALVLKKLYGSKVVIDKDDVNFQLSAHHQITPRNLLSGINIALGEWIIKRYADIVFTINSHLRKMYEGKVKGQVRMSPPSLFESDEYDNVPKDINVFADCKADFKLVCVGASESYFYGIFPFIKALSELRQRYDLHLYIVGTKKETYMNTLSEKLLEDNMENHTTFLSNVAPEKMLSLYANADILLLAQVTPEIAEGGFPAKTAEYFASGVPVITTLFSDLGKYFVDEKNCLVVQHDDIASYKAAFCKLFDSDELCESLGKEGKKTAIEYFDYLKGTRPTINYFAQICTN
jgi:glycosyltransferase involved in cell wall biosynthesis